MGKDFRSKIEKGIYQIVLSLCLLILVIIIRSDGSEDLVTVIRWLAIVIFVILAYHLYRWLNKEE